MLIELHGIACLYEYKRVTSILNINSSRYQKPWNTVNVFQMSSFFLPKTISVGNFCHFAFIFIFKFMIDAVPHVMVTRNNGDAVYADMSALLEVFSLLFKQYSIFLFISFLFIFSFHFFVFLFNFLFFSLLWDAKTY